ncbi:MAG: excinuclease ABC subunit A, partial [Bacteroidota bacterium]|nr:excinuclease ABC subunit A [Bacteroidota bacterium]
LKMTVDESLEFFSNTNDKFESKIFDKIKPLQDVGLGYVQLGQSSSTLSGGESQRIKMASFLGQRKTTKKTLFIFDEPTTGLHFHDIKTLLKALNALVDNGNHVVIIEHNSEIIKSADWVIDIGPEGGKEGGNIIFEGTPEKLVLCKNSYTGNYLKDKL